MIGGELARALGLKVPELTLVDLDPVLGRAEPDPEIQDLIVGSAGLNLGVDFLPSALPFNPAAGFDPGPELSADVIWLDALITNVDRTARNTNLLVWHDELWLIDHGAALFFHHAASPDAEHARKPFPSIREHVLLPFAGSIVDADARLGPRVTAELLETVVRDVPDDWLDDVGRPDYVAYLSRRLAAPRSFVEEAESARVGR
ncbi:MAG: hypothetical protein QOK22_3019 [Gaiellaceae bacterium]|nr:hypothetical protein [Gaiellaceae bacterium]